MIKTGNGVIVFDPYKYMPGYGENSIEIILKRDYLSMHVYYDGLNNIEEKIILNFPSVKFFFKNCIS